VIRDVAEPIAGIGQAVVAVVCAAVNFPDVLFIQNRYQVSIPTPFVPGSEFAGTVLSVGPGVTSVVPGDRVFGAVMTGAYAEQVVVAADALRRIPEGVSFEAAAGFWVAHATAYHAIRSIADVAAGETVAVLGAAGGVGLAAVELAAARGADVVAVASTDEKLALCASRGAAHGVNYEREPLRDGLRRVAPNGLDVVLDPVGGPHAEQAARALGWKGRFVTIGFASGEIPRIPLNLVLLKGFVIKGFEIRTFAQHEPELAARDEGELLALLATGRISPHVSAAYPLAEVARALGAVAGRMSTGKVLLSTAPGAP
jgi:NADPH2:quinone reductase